MLRKSNCPRRGRVMIGVFLQPHARLRANAAESGSVSPKSTRRAPRIKGVRGEAGDAVNS